MMPCTLVDRAYISQGLAAFIFTVVNEVCKWCIIARVSEELGACNGDPRRQLPRCHVPKKENCSVSSSLRDKWVPVTTAWRVLRLRMEERPPILRVAANVLNKQSRTADEGWSSSLGVGRGANNDS